MVGHNIFRYNFYYTTCTQWKCAVSYCVCVIDCLKFKHARSNYCRLNYEKKSDLLCRKEEFLFQHSEEEFLHQTIYMYFIWADIMPDQNLVLFWHLEIWLDIVRCPTVICNPADRICMIHIYVTLLLLRQQILTSFWSHQ